MIGLKHNQNFLVDYDPEWPFLFEKEKALLQNVLVGIPHGIEHFGSTAISGLSAKPIIDIIIGILPLTNWAQCKQPLESLGYDYAEHAGVFGHYIFGRGRDLSERTHLVHIVEFNGQSWRFNLALRDALKANRDLMQEYLIVKQTASDLAPEGRAKYNERKQVFFDKVTYEYLSKLAKTG